ncbi:LssY C-terminal domain-containing protein [Alicyclobacillus fastidiosus]|uniref:LssY C-terminal domain-containing protein n=1 Tax=Alicyclobacillus fastidiosus TaxID=392011 RepID=A0ABY6ZC23_9BACL|nr:LssY C-terminal domain-containing protein [Alicyclobacillus fastidiosus]WAH39801.1 LssY C-terminal domain-containing protein [Alicyclobacillus fastidiosus]GMA61054.1 hypothetical protein GCM10025859_14940 [Alicyclobacillus fastidiosus]
MYKSFNNNEQISLDKYPKCSLTKHGRPGDPINILILADKTVITQVFLKAGWKIPDPVSGKTGLKIGVDSIFGKPYPTAPVSNLYLYARKEDLAFERPGKTARTREHIRLWDTGDLYDGEAVWIGSATYDNGIELSHVNDLPTHHIDADVDKERDSVVSQLKPFMVSKIKIPYSTPTNDGHNGEGDRYYTDGYIAILSAEKSVDKGNFMITTLK